MRTKFLFFSILTILFTYSKIFSQQGSIIIFDTTQYNIRSFHTFKINGSQQKFVLLQQGLQNTIMGTTGGNYYYLNSDRVTWANVPYLNSLCCAVQNICYPIDYLNVSQTNSSIMILNGIYQCSSPQALGDYSKITYNGGSSLSFLPFKGVDSVQQCRGFDISKTNSNIMYMAHTYYEGVYFNEPRIFKSTNAGLNWFVTDTLAGMKPISYNVPPDGAGFLKALTWNHDVVFTVTNDHPAYSLTGGYDFQIRTDLPVFKMIVFDEGDHWIHGVALDNRIFCNNGGITNNWVPASNPFNILCIEIDPDNHTIWYAGSENSGVWRSTNAGIVFHPYNNSFTPSRKVIGISKDSGSGDTIIVATDKRVYKVWQSLIVDIDPTTNSIPSHFRLYQNYPNPFNPGTIINYELPPPVRAGITNFITLKVYDALGKEVVTLVNEKQNFGNYSVQFDGSNFASGIYFYRLEVEFSIGVFSETRRMILLK